MTAEGHEDLRHCEYGFRVVEVTFARIAIVKSGTILSSISANFYACGPSRVTVGNIMYPCQHITVTGIA